MDQVPHYHISEVSLTRSEDVPGPEVPNLLDEVHVVLQIEPRYLDVDNLRLSQDIRLVTCCSLERKRPSVWT